MAKFSIANIISKKMCDSQSMTLENHLKRIGLQFGIFLFAVIFSLGFISSIILHSQHSIVADNFTLLMREPVLFGDMRRVAQEVNSLSHSSPAIKFVRFVDHKGKRIFRSHGMRDDHLFSFSWSIKRNLFFDQKNLIPAGYFEFEFLITEFVMIYLGITLLVILVGIWLFLKIRKITIQLYDNELKNRLHQSIAQTTQMLAHDVRKPFTLLQALINIVTDSKDTKETQRILQESLPSITSALSSINSMIADVMEVGAESKLNQEAVEPIDLIKSTLSNLFMFNEIANIEIQIKLDHRNKVNVDSHKSIRIFSNIIGNAVEHMKGSGKIWIETCEVNGMIRFCLGNTNTFIPEEDRKKLFEAFYTKNKSGGTGLGLAIAKKITEAHGGEIWCESSVQRGTEFFFTLPTSIEQSAFGSKDYSMHSRDFLKKLTFSSEPPTSSPKKDQNSNDNLDIENQMIRHSNFLNRGLNLAIVDNEDIYQKSLKNHLMSSSEISKIVDLQVFSQAESLIREIGDKKSFDLVILDIDYGPGKISGFDAIDQLRLLGFNGKICVHSNRVDPEFLPNLNKNGANNLFLPKPMAREQFFSLLLSTFLEFRKSPSHARQIILFEDELIFQRQWKRVLGSDRLLVYQNWSEFLVDWENGLDWNHFEYVVTDYFLAHGESGSDIAQNLKNLKCTRPIFLCSQVENLTAEESENFSRMVSKDPLRAEKEIEDYFSNNAN